MSRTVTLITTWTLPDDFLGASGTAYFDDGAFEQFVDELAQVAGFARGVGATSPTNVTPAVGPKSFVTHQSADAVAIPVGALVRIQSMADPAKRMLGTVAAFAGTALDVTVTIASGGAASDWVISYAVPAAVAALYDDLDGNGFSLTEILNITATGLATLNRVTATEATVSTLLTVAAGMQSGSLYLGDVSGDVVIEASDPLHIYCTIVGDTTFLIAGGTIPGTGHDHLIHWTMGGAGGYAVTILPANLLLNTDDFSTTWTATSGNTVSVNDTVAPDGTTTADTITWATTADTRRQDVSVANDSASYMAVCFFKEAAGAFAALQLAFTGGTTKDSYARVNLETGDAVATGSGAGTATVTSVAAANGYWKVTISNANNGLGNTVLRVSIQKVASDSSQLTGDLKVWRGNLFAGASELGTQKVGATRAGQVYWQGTPTTFPAIAAAGTGDLAISIEPDGRIVVQDHTVEEL